VRIQPATQSSEYDESQYGWAAADTDKEVSECIRDGRITWKNGKLTGSVDDRECASPEQPKAIQVEADGRIVVK